MKEGGGHDHAIAGFARAFDEVAHRQGPTADHRDFEAHFDAVLGQDRELGPDSPNEQRLGARGFCRISGVWPKKVAAPAR